MGDGSATRFELFLTAIVTKFLTKVAKILGKLFELFWKTSFLAETAVTTFEKFGLLFIPSFCHTDEIGKMEIDLNKSLLINFRLIKS